MMEKLTKEQIIDKWNKIHLSTQQYLDEDIINSINELYKSVKKSKPEIIILNSYKQCANYIKYHKTDVTSSFVNYVDSFFSHNFCNSVWDFLWFSIYDSISENVYNNIKYSIYTSVYSSLWKEINNAIMNCIYYPIFLEYCINILQIKNLEYYKPFLHLSEIIHFAILENNIAIVCRKLKSVHLDDNNQLHGDGIKSYEFNDSYGYYFNRGTLIPTKYGKVKIKNWKPQWLLTETNTELKRLLIREIGYDKIAKELNSTIIHKQDNMELLEIPNIDIEPMRLLKVQCPSTNSIYLLRVPPDINKCEECRQWTLFNENEEYEFVKES